MNRNYVIDGSFLCCDMYGMQRYAWEITKIWDASPEIAAGFTVLVPAYLTNEIPLKNIPVVRYGTHKGKLWRQLDLAGYLRKHHCRGLFFENIIPFRSRCGAVVLHDIILRARQRYFLLRPRSVFTLLFWRMIYYGIIHSRMPIVTVSEFSKNEILKYYRVSPERIRIVGNGWEHMERILPESPPDSVSEAIRGRRFLLAAASSSMRHKNVPWFYRAARQNPGLLFVVAGGISEKDRMNAPSNVLMPGFLSDGQIKALMRQCTAFVMPSYYEGFGIPPLEAAACGAPRLILSDIPVLREIYGGHAQFFDPDGNGEELPSCLEQPVTDFASLLAEHTWKASARELLRILTEV